MRQMDITINGVLFKNISVTETEQDRRKGLEDCTSLSENEGMIYFFRDDMRLSFCNYNPILDLEAIMVTGDGIVSDIHVMPKSDRRADETWPEYKKRCPVFKSRRPCRYVFEFKPGTAKRLGIKANERMEVNWRELLPNRGVENIEPDDVREYLQIPVGELRAPLVELFQYIPYLEERVGGTFKFQYWDEEAHELKDMEGCEESNRTAKFPDPVSNDETWQTFEDIAIGKISDKFMYGSLAARFRETRLSDWERPENKLGQLLFELIFAVIHERMFTGYTELCMKKGEYLKFLRLIKDVLEELPDDAVVSCPLTEYGKKWLARHRPGEGSGTNPPLS